MYERKKFVRVFTSKFVRTETSSYEKRFYQAAVSQMLRNTEFEAFAVVSVQSSRLWHHVVSQVNTSMWEEHAVHLQGLKI
jgi:hypothetical protein